MIFQQMKQAWDMAVVYAGSGFYFGTQYVQEVDVESTINMIVGVLVGIFTAIRIFYMIKNKGITHKK